MSLTGVENVLARTYRRTLYDSQVSQCLFDCRDGKDAYQTYVVTPSRQLESAVIHEVVAALLGQELGLPIQPVAVVELDTRVAHVIPDTRIRRLFIDDPGPHFGRKHAGTGFLPVPYGWAMPASLIPHALQIFAFDVLIQNHGRTGRTNRQHPNVLSQGDGFLLFNHSQTFSPGCEDDNELPTWHFRGEDWILQHIFFKPILRYAMHRRISFEHFIVRLESISDDWLTELKVSMPEVWQNSAVLDRAITRIQRARDQAGRFEHSLLEIFA